RDLRDGLDGADLVVGVHDGDETGSGADRAGDVGGIDEAVRVDGDAGDRGALALQPIGGGGGGGGAGCGGGRGGRGGGRGVGGGVGGGGAGMGEGGRGEGLGGARVEAGRAAPAPLPEGLADLVDRQRRHHLAEEAVAPLPRHDE